MNGVCTTLSVERSLIPQIVCSPKVGLSLRCRLGPDPGDVVQARHRVSERGQLGLDLGAEVDDVRAENVDAGEHLGQQELVVVGEVPHEGLLQRGDLGPHPCPGRLGQDLRVALPAGQGSHHLSAGDSECRRT